MLSSTKSRLVVLCLIAVDLDVHRRPITAMRIRVRGIAVATAVELEETTNIAAVFAVYA